MYVVNSIVFNLTETTDSLNTMYELPYTMKVLRQKNFVASCTHRLS